MLHPTLKAWLLALAFSGAAHAQDHHEAVVARVNSAVVRVFAVRGVQASWTTSGLNPSVHGPDANWGMEYGTGVALRPDLIVTAKHVVWGCDIVVVIPAGSSTALPARVVYSDPEADFALVAVGGRLPHVITLAAHPSPPSVGADLWLTGFPMDWHETTPAVARATLSRVAADGRLTLNTNVNPGNSGGPVFDVHGALQGLVVERGDPAQGVAGVATAEPATAIVRGLHELGSARAPAFDAFEQALAPAFATSLQGPTRETAGIEAVSATLSGPLTPVERAVAAVFAWGVLRQHLWLHDTNAVSALAADEQAFVERQRLAAVENARRALTEAPYLRVNYSFLLMLVRSNGSLDELTLRIPHDP